eukprot:281034-Pelagomonas_calceolata.AAC.6
MGSKSLPSLPRSAQHEAGLVTESTLLLEHSSSREQGKLVAEIDHSTFQSFLFLKHGVIAGEADAERGSPAAQVREFNLPRHPAPCSALAATSCRAPGSTSRRPVCIKAVAEAPPAGSCMPGKQGVINDS